MLGDWRLSVLGDWGLSVLGARRLSAAVALGMLLAATPVVVAAHPLGNFSVNRYAAIRIEPEAVEVRYLVDMAEIPTFQEMQEWGISAQADHPATMAYLDRQGEALRRGLRLYVDGRPLALSVQSRQVLFAPGAADLPTMKISMVYRTPLEQVATGRLVYRDENFANRVGWQEVVARGGPGTLLAASDVPERDRSRELSNYPADLLNSPPQVATADVVFERVPIPASAAVRFRDVGPTMAPAPAAAGLVARESAASAAVPGEPRDAAGRRGPDVDGERRGSSTRAGEENSGALAVALRAVPVAGRTPVAVPAPGVAPPENQPAAPVGPPVGKPDWAGRDADQLDNGSGPTGGNSRAPLGGNASGGAVSRPPGSRSALTDLMTRRDLGPGLLLFAMATAMVLGAFHALEPGHGKTVVAAYLVGSRGTAWHAVLLGLAVTVSHTAGVFLLGAVTLYASRYVMPERLYPWLGALSGLAIAGVGLALIRQRWAGSPHGHGHDHGHAHPHAHDHGPHVHPHPHDDSPHIDPQTHEHASPPHAQHHHETPPAHEHHHHEAHPAHAHHHDEGPHAHHHHHHHVPAGRASVRGLLALGLSGGIVPCPGALVVLLSALAWRRLGLGILLVVAFSVGLAAVLVAIGILMVHARRLLGRLRDDGPLTTRWLPLASSAVVTVLGVLIAVQALANAGIIGFRLGG